MSLFNYFAARRERKRNAEEEERRETDSYKLGQSIGDQIAHQVLAFMQVRFEPMRSSYLDLFKERLKTIFDEPDHEPAVVARVELNIFYEQVDKLHAQLRDEMSAFLTDAYALAEAARMRAEVETAAHQRLRDACDELKVAGVELTAQDAGGAILERKGEPKRLIRPPRSST